MCIVNSKKTIVVLLLSLQSRRSFSDILLYLVPLFFFGLLSFELTEYRLNILNFLQVTIKKRVEK